MGENFLEPLERQLPDRFKGVPRGPLDFPLRVVERPGDRLMGA